MHPFTTLGALVILAACGGAPSGPSFPSRTPVATPARHSWAAIAGRLRAATLPNRKTEAEVAFSDAPTSAWKIETTPLSTPSVTDVSFDTTSVNNGDSVKVTVTLKAKPANVLAGKAHERVALVSTGTDGRSHAWPIIVYAQ